MITTNSNDPVTMQVQLNGPHLGRSVNCMLWLTSSTRPSELSNTVKIPLGKHHWMSEKCQFLILLLCKEFQPQYYVEATIQQHTQLVVTDNELSCYPNSNRAHCINARVSIL